MESAPLTTDELRRLYQADRGAVIVGGQALAYWALAYPVQMPPELESSITEDLDYLGNRDLAAAFAAGFQRARVFYPDPDDHTPNSAIVEICDFIEEGRIYPVLVDFLHTMQGIPDNDKFRARAVKVWIDGVEGMHLMMHPMDCLLSRIANLRLPSKQNSKGAAQAKLAVSVFREWLTSKIDHACEAERAEAEIKSELRSVYRFAGLVGELAKSDLGIEAYTKWGVDVLLAINAERFPSEQFRARSWPEAVGEAVRKRESLIARRDKIAARKTDAPEATTEEREEPKPP